MNPYEVLGVPPDSSAEHIKKVYRELASIHHPDKGGSHERFADMQAAYNILKDADKRSRYDQTGDVRQAADPIYQAAITELSRYFMMQIDNPQQNNIITAIRSQIGSQIQQHNQFNVRMQQELVRLDKLYDRIQCSDEINLFQGVIDKKRTDIDLKLQKTDEAVKIGKRMLEMLDAYTDGRPVHSITYTSTSTTGAF